MTTPEAHGKDDLAARLERALAAWSEMLGTAHVTKDARSLRAWQTATFHTTQIVFAVLHPGDTAMVSACMAIASQHRVPVYPVSRGRNWGLGSRVPVTDAVVLDLSRMDAILALDERFGTLTVEPGVTFEQAYAFLTERDSRWFIPAIGGPPDASVMGNFIERGDASGPQADRVMNICTVQVVLPGGEVMHTGFQRFGDGPLSGIASSPAGPLLHGLFTQSNLGVVTQMTISMALQPEHLQVAYSPVPRGNLAGFVEALQPLIPRLAGSVSITLWNGHKFNARPDKTPVAADDWYFSAGLYAASATMAQAQRELVQKALQPVAEDLIIYDEGAVPDLRQQAGNFVGRPEHGNVLSLYTRKGAVPTGPLDPDRDGCGVLWLCPELPLQGDTIALVTGNCERILKSFGFAPILGMVISYGRTARLFVSIFYDRHIAGEDARAMECHNDLQTMLATEGCYPFRLGIASMDSIARMEAGAGQFLETLKDAIDPGRIIAPGRYSR